MFRSLFLNTVYVRVSKNQFQLRHIDSKIEIVVTPTHPFTTERLLVGDFQSAQQTLKNAVKQLTRDSGRNRFLSPSPKMVVHPIEMTEGGLSTIEERVFLELAHGAGAYKAKVWVGFMLNDAEVSALLNT